jgi:uncharacterized protein YfaS (alpha-2-macroglobulin family)
VEKKGDSFSPIFVLVLIFLLVPITAIAGPASIQFFSPEGTVKGVRQVTARFSEQMAVFGDPNIAAPFEVKCPAKGTGRWADGKNWVYDFEKDLPAGIICTFTLKSDVKSTSGTLISGKKEFTFSTGGPAILRSYPSDGDNSIEEDQAFILFTDAQPKEESILANAWCQIEDINEPIGVEIIKSRERNRILKSMRFYQPPSDHITIVKCRRNFPNEKSVKFIWGKGLESESGVATAQDQSLAFKSRAPFTARFSCDRENKASLCIPLLPMEINFTGSVSAEQARKVIMKGQGKTYLPTVSEDEDYVSSVVFKGPFPEHAEFEIELPSDMKDDAGRSLLNKDKYPLRVRTSPYPPLAKFAADFGIIEKSNPYLPITVRNIEAQIKARLLEINSGRTHKAKAEDGLTDTGVQAAGAPGKTKPGGGEEITGSLRGRIEQVDKEADIIRRLVSLPPREEDRRKISLLRNDPGARTFEIPKPNSEKSFEVIGIPLKKTGFYMVEAESLLLGKSLLGKAEPMYVTSTALVTNMAVHFKWGRESSLVWVTSLDKAEPVGDARVSILDCNGKAYWQGNTETDGTALIKEHLPSNQDVPSCKDGRSGGLFVFARTPDDLSFVSSRWTEGIEPWRFQLPGGTWDESVAAHTIFDRTLFRAGETVHMKHILREKTGQGFGLLRKDKLPNTLKIEHYGTNQTYTLPLTWDADDGIGESTWEIPKDANLGNYTVTLSTGKKTASGTEQAGKANDSENNYQSGWFGVEEYKVPLMKGSIQLLTDPIINKKEVDIDLQVNYLAGGSAQGLPVRLRHQTERKHLRFDDYEYFTFTNGEVREGIVRERENAEGEGEEEQGDYVSTATRKKMEKNIATADLKLGEGGSVRTRLSDLPVKPYPQALITELEYKDPNGQIQTVSRRTNIYPSGILVGIKPASWQATKDSFGFQLAALDIKGKPVAGIEIKAEVFLKKRYSHRKRLIGGFYSYEYVTETKKIGPICEGKTDEKGLVICESPAPVSGNLIIQAKATDAEGNASVVNQDVWVTGEEDMWFHVEDHDRIDVIPERKKYEPGEKARFQVRMPFREATALVTVEREGILDKYIMNISGKDPVIEIPVKKNYSPNIFVSVLCVRGRVGSIQPTAMVDLGKPAYKLGIAYINVGWRANELKVKVSADHEVYKVRQKAHVKILVTKSDGGPANGEVAVAAVDEGLLELRPNESWNILAEMMQRRGYEVETSTAQMQVVGKRHFGLKALPQGGGGGHLPTRELFDTLLLWKGRVKLDDKGEATVDIPLNDSITSFRIVAVATSGVNRFGTGQTSIRSSQDLMLFSGLPAMVRQGDSFRAGFSVRNASDRSMDITLSGKYSSGKAENELPELKEKLSPGEAKEASWLIDVPKGAETLKWNIAAAEVNGSARDAIGLNQKVAKAVPVRAFQATIFQLDRNCNMQVEKPKEALPGRGGINVSLKPSITGGLDGVIGYMKDYPYTCMEQKVSRAISLKDDTLWEKVVRELPSHMDSDGLIKYFPSMNTGSEVLTSYILSISNEAGRAIPADLREKMKTGLKGFINGSVRRYPSFAAPDLTVRKLMAAEALSRYGGLDPRLLDSITIEPNLWPTSAVLDWLSILSHTGNVNVPDRDKRTEEAQQIIRSRLNFQGSIMTFSTERTDFLWWLMLSGDTNAVKTVLSLIDMNKWKEDMPRIVRGAIARQHKGHWLTTTANAWGVLAVDKFAKRFEAARVNGLTTAAMSGKEETLDWAKQPHGKTLFFAWPKVKDNLHLAHAGQGKPWATAQSLAAIPLKAPLSSGYRVLKTIVPVSQKEKGKWSVGDVARIKLEMEAQSDMSWVVVNDPVPAGASILGIGLGRDSALLTQGEEWKGYVWPAFEERSFESYRAYFEFVPKGKWQVEYTIRLNNEGNFLLPDTRVEALYSPEMFGENPNAEFRIRP